MIAPPPSSCMCGRTACAAKNWGLRFTSSALSQYSTVTSSILCRSSLAALLTRMPIGPSTSRDLGDRGPQRLDVGDVALEEQRAGFLGERVARVILDVDEGDLAPRSAAKARTMSAPMPDAPPVTKTTRPARLG